MAFTAKIADIIAADKTGLLACHDSWQRVPLCDVASILNGAPFDAALFNTTRGTPLARIRDVLGGTTSTYYTGDFDDAYLLEQGDLLIGMDGDFNIGYWGAQRALLNQRVCKLTANPDHYDKKFLGFVLPGYLAAINANTPSITVKHLSSRTVGEIELPLPPRAEQTRIVEKLEELLGGFDAAVGELKAAQRKLTHYRQSLLKAAMEGALTEAWRSSPSPCPRSGQGEVGRGSLLPSDKSTPPQPSPSPSAKGREQETGTQLLHRILQERRTRWEAKQQAKFAQTSKTPPKGWQAKYPEPAAPDTTDLPALPEGWAWATIDQLAHVGTGVTPLRSKRAYFDGGSIPWTTSGALNDELVETANEHVTQLALEECRLEIYPAGSLLVAMYGEGKTRGKCAELGFPSTINQAIAAIVFEGAAATVRSHVKTVLLDAYEAMRKQASGGVQPNLNLQIIKAFPVPLPPLEEQAEIMSVLDTALSAVKEQETAITHSLHQAAAQRHNLLRAAFSGQLVPQDPNDEPASELLARIRAAKADNARPAAATKRGRKPKGNT